MISSAAAKAVGVAYVLHRGDEQCGSMQPSIVTVSSTTVDKQGILKSVIYPRMIHPYPSMTYPSCPQRGTSVLIDACRAHPWRIPLRHQCRVSNYTQELSLVFFWSIPLAARYRQLPTRPSLILESWPSFERHSMKISIGIQNVSLASDRSLLERTILGSSRACRHIATAVLHPIGTRTIELRSRG